MNYHKRRQQQSIGIIGGGVSGITTALTLQLLGFDTRCYAEHLVDEQAPSDPRFASLYPAASVIPHSVSTSRMDTLFHPSQTIFDFLYQQNIPSIRLHRHYEVYEFPVDDPDYAGLLKAYERLENTNDPCLPHYSSGPALYGWSFECLVTEWPRYMKQMYSWYREAGGTITRQKLSQDDIKALDSDLIINCSGIWSRELFNEPGPLSVERGHLLFIPGAPLVTHSDDTVISYNYTPQAEVYCDPAGNPCDVYFYPRSNGWVLGGSRQAGTINIQNCFEGKEHSDPVMINGVSVPSQILELNKKIISDTFNLDLDDSGPIKARTGYRFIRNLDKYGLRLDHAEFSDQTVIHNYGHGGAGVTLSWGCALEVERMVRQQGYDSRTGLSDYGSDFLNRLQKLLREFTGR